MSHTALQPLSVPGGWSHITWELIPAGVGTMMLSLQLMTPWIGFFVIGEILCVVWGLSMMLRLVLQAKGGFNLLRVLAASTLLGNSFGAVMSLAFSQTDSVGGFDTILAFLSIDLIDLAVAQIIVNGFVGALLLFTSLRNFNHFESELAQRLAAMIGTPDGERYLKQVAFIMTGLQAFALATGLMGYKTIAATDETLNPFTLLLVTLAPASVFAAGALFGHLISRPWRLSLWLWPLAIGTINLIWFFAGGRTQFVYAIVMGVFGYAWVRGPVIFKFVILAVAILLPLTVAMFIFSAAIRQFQMVDEFARERVDVAIVRSLEESRKLSESERQSLKVGNDFNLAQRPLVLNYIAMLVKQRREYGAPWLGFEDLTNNLLNTVPRQIYRGKGGLLLAEGLYSERLGMPASDNADSLTYSAYASFGMLGLLFFPLLIWLFIKACLAGLLLFQSDKILICGVAAMTWLMLTGGEIPLASLFVVPRNLFIAAVVIKVIEFLLQGRRASIAPMIQLRDIRNAQPPVRILGPRARQ